MTIREYLIGAGGWAYFHVPELEPLVAYSKVFNFVEVNSTFYQLPSLEKVEKWRKLVPPSFKFSVRAHQSITHRYALQPINETFEALNYMKRICDALNADILHVQVPQSYKSAESLTNNLQNLLPSTNLQGLRLALEIRRAESSHLPPELLKVMTEHNIIHCVDLSKGEMPAYESDILYTRLFGKGKHNVYQPTDTELLEIDKRALSRKSEKIITSFHFVRMYKDAARLKTYKRTGKFPMVTKSTGLTSLKEVLDEDTRFPSTRQELISSQGWKIFDLNQNSRVRGEDALDKLPDGTYNSLDEVVDRLRSMMS